MLHPLILPHRILTLDSAGDFKMPHSARLKAGGNHNALKSAQINIPKSSNYPIFSVHSPQNCRTEFSFWMRRPRYANSSDSYDNVLLKLLNHCKIKGLIYLFLKICFTSKKMMLSRMTRTNKNMLSRIDKSIIPALL